MSNDKSAATYHPNGDPEMTDPEVQHGKQPDAAPEVVHSGPTGPQTPGGGRIGHERVEQVEVPPDQVEPDYVDEPADEPADDDTAEDTDATGDEDSPEDQ